MSFFKKVLEFSNNDTHLQEEKRKTNELFALQAYIDKYKINGLIALLYRKLILNGFSAKEAINLIDDNKTYSSLELLLFNQLEEIYTTKDGLDYHRYKEAVISYFSKL